MERNILSPAQVVQCQNTRVGVGYTDQIQLEQGHHVKAQRAIVLSAFACSNPLIYLWSRCS